ncbi:hypothetical protein ACFWBH_23905 [Streptomyces sp. NPDC059999]|uniref:hypothetical protein n=1 Tax=Streptomyces sp. NPDC059999 TaxID=3347030 RepID=UPI003685DC87
MATGTTGSGSGRPGQIEAAWGLTLAAVAAEVLVWFLGAFVAPPTSLDELTEYAGRDAAIVRIALGAGALAVLLVAWLVVAGRMRAGRGWARAVLTVVGVGFLVFRAGGLGTVEGPAWWSALNALPDLLAAAAVVPMYLSRARSHFLAGPAPTA